MTLSPVVPRAACLLAGLAVSLRAAVAGAAECDPPSGLGPCLDAEALWFAPGAARFVGVPGAETVRSRAFATGIGATWLLRPVVVTAASPDPDGREVRVVEHLVDLSLLLAYGASDRLELDLAFPIGLRQTGAGAGGLTSQDAPPLARSVVRDPRVGAAWALVRRRTGSFWALAGRLELSLPLGDEGELSGDAGPVVSPVLALDVERGAFFGASALGARLRRTSELAGARLGSQLVAQLGLGCEILGPALSLGAEAWVLPVLASQDRTLPDGTRVADALLVPAEWMASLRSMPLASGDLGLQLGAGAGLPLSTERRIAPDGTDRVERFAGITSPAVRVALAVRYAPVHP